MQLGAKAVTVLGLGLLLGGGTTEQSVQPLPVLGQALTFDAPITVAVKRPRLRWQVGVRMGMFKRVGPAPLDSRPKGA